MPVSLKRCRIRRLVEDMEKGYAWIVLLWEANGNVRELLAFRVRRVGHSRTFILSERVVRAMIVE